MKQALKLFIIALTCLIPLSGQAHPRIGAVRASNDIRSSQFEATPPCPNCATESNISKSVRALRNTLTAQATAEQISAIGEKMKWGDACENFTSDDEYGKWAMMIMKELKSNEAEALLRGSDDLVRICPGYKSLNLDGRQKVWVLIMNAMTFYESTCNKNSQAKGPNGSLIGLLQLHRGKEHVYAPNCKKGDGSTPAGTFRCSISMLNSQLERGEPLFSRKSYWDVLRPQARSKKFAKIQKAIKSFALCH